MKEEKCKMEINRSKKETRWIVVLNNKVTSGLTIKSDLERSVREGENPVV